MENRRRNPHLLQMTVRGVGRAFFWGFFPFRVLPFWEFLSAYARAYCGPLCSSIGFAARWMYWLLVGIVGVFLIQLGIWTYTWVIFPILVHIRALFRYFRGEAPWSEVSRLLGERPFRPNWKGPCAGEPWTVAYVQTEVRGRGANRLPFDLLVTDGTAIARLRHGTIRGRTNRHGFVCACDEVKSSHRYFRNLLEAAECRVHLCAQQPCTAEDEQAVHVGTSAVISQAQEVDLQDLAGRGPWARCAILTWFCSCLWCTCFSRAIRKIASCCRGCLSRVCCLRSPRRASRPGTGNPTPRHDDSETESEADEGNPCQADQVGMDFGSSGVKPLASEPCRDLSRGSPEPLLKADEVVSCQDGLQKGSDGSCLVCVCDYHRAIYQASQKGRTCSVEGCYNTPYYTKAGVRLCRLHGAKEEKKPRVSRTRNASDTTPPPVESGLLESKGQSLPTEAKRLLPSVTRRLLSFENPGDSLKGLPG